MTWSYSTAETSDKDKVRGKIGDIQEDRPILSDEALLALIGEYPVGAVDLTSVAIKAVRRIIASRARSVDRSGAGINTSRGQEFDHWVKLLEILMADRSESSETTNFVGGIYQSQDLANDSESGLKRPAFSIGYDDFAGGSRRSTDPGSDSE